MNAERDLEVFRRDGFKCVYCDFDARTFEHWAFLAVDHFVPRSRGGTDDINNLVTACVLCNHMKGAALFSTLDDARKEIQSWWAGMRDFWEKKVEHLVPSN
jgi:5-methylcytosine-specific restriction endonuclease McrA